MRHAVLYLSMLSVLPANSIADAAYGEIYEGFDLTFARRAAAVVHCEVRLPAMIASEVRNSRRGGRKVGSFDL